GFILAALVLSFAEPAYLPDPQGAIDAALFNALALAGTAWTVAVATAPFLPPVTREDASARPGRRELAGFALLVLTAICLQMLFYNTIDLPEIRTGVIAVLLTADPDLWAVWRRMRLRQLCAAGCAALALLMIAVGAPWMDDLGSFAVLAGCCYFAAGWVAHGGPRISFFCVPGAGPGTLLLLLDGPFSIDILPRLLKVARVLFGLFVAARIPPRLAP